MLIKAERTCLLLVDMQQRLMTAIHQSQQVIANNAWLMQIATTLNIPMLLSEQYPRGLGHTVAELLELAPPDSVMEKLCFSCAAEPSCMTRIDALQRDQIIITGTEAHVCVLQSALGLLQAGKEVYVVADCISSRHPRNVELAISRMQTEGVKIVSREMVAFEWLHQAGTEQFRTISRQFLR